MEEFLSLQSLQKPDIENYLADIRQVIKENRFSLARRPKNKALTQDFILSEQDELDIIASLTADDFSDAVKNEHPGYEHETLFIFGTSTSLLERFGENERIVNLYIKFNKLENMFVFIISFHEQEFPMHYYFT